jgi:hypothetical protein
MDPNPQWTQIKDAVLDAICEVANVPRSKVIMTHPITFTGTTVAMVLANLHQRRTLPANFQSRMVDVTASPNDLIMAIHVHTTKKTTS